MKIIASTVVLLFCLGTAYGQAKVAITALNGLIETNSIGVVQCAVTDFKPDAKTTPSFSVSLKATFGDSANIINLGTWTQGSEKDVYGKVTFAADGAATTAGIDISSVNDTFPTFQARLTLKTAVAKGFYYCDFTSMDSQKKPTPVSSAKIESKDSIYSVAVVVSTEKTTVAHPFTVTCNATQKDPKAPEQFEVSQVEFLLESTSIGTYTVADDKEHKNKVAKFAPVTVKEVEAKLEAKEGTNKLPNEYQITVNPKAKTAAGKYECIVTAQLKTDTTKKRTYISNDKPVAVNSGARWVAPSIAFILFNLALFLHL